MLQQVTTRAEHSDGQWTRFKFDPSNDTDDRDTALDAAELKGHTTVASKADTSHEAAIFGLPDNHKERERRPGHKAAQSVELDSDSDADDPPQVVELPDEAESLSATLVTDEKGKPKPAWREKLALMQAKRATEQKT